jgi:hypothetical protein
LTEELTAPILLSVASFLSKSRAKVPNQGHQQANLERNFFFEWILWTRKELEMVREIH